MTESSLSLRPMVRADLDSVLVIERAAYPIPWSRAILEDCLSSYECSMLFSERQDLGYCVVSKILDEVHLLNLCVNPEFSGKGLGRWLLRELIRKAVEHGSSMFFLEVRESNQAAIELYRSEGFNETGLRKNYYPAKSGREHAILMSLDLKLDTYA